MAGKPRDKISGQWVPEGDEPLDRRVIGIKLPVSLYQVVAALPNRNQWLKRVIAEAAQKELMAPDKEQSSN